jgi:hypothetical protein
MTSYQPGEQPSYAQPQDPWQGTQGSASPPTDPIPQPARGQFRPGVATPQAPPPNVWQQETIAHDDRYGYQPAPRSRAGLYVLVTLVVLAVGGIGGYGAWYLITNNLTIQTPSTGPSEQPGSSSPATFNPALIQRGDCLLNTTPDGAQANMTRVPCDTENAYRVLEIGQGESLQEGENGEFNDATANSVCLGVEGWIGPYFVWQSTNDALDFLFCLEDAAP